MAPTRRIALLLTVYAVFVAVGGTMAEVLFRHLRPEAVPGFVPPPQALNPYGPNHFIRYGRPWLFFHIPGSRYTQERPAYRVDYRINSRGFRGPEPAAPDARRPRLVVVGDSIVEGHGAEEHQRFTELLTDWDTVNAGMQGASPIYYAANVERYLDLKPRVILLLLFENDISEDRVRESGIDDWPRLAGPGVLLLKDRWVSRSALLSQALGNARTMLQRFPIGEVEQIAFDSRMEYRPNQEQHELAQISPILVAPSLWDMQWGLTARYLDYFLRRAAAAGVEVRVASLSMVTLQPGQPAPFLPHARTLDQKIREWAQARGVPCLSLTTDMLRVHPSELGKLMIPGDGHLSTTGHRWVAERLSTWLGRRP
jgi:hypothetical protein